MTATAEELAREIAAGMSIPADVPMTDEQAAEFRERFEAHMRENGRHWRSEIKLLPPRKLLTEDTVRELLRDHLTVLGPGEVVIIRTASWTPGQAWEYQQELDRWHAGGNLPFRAIVVHGDELAVVKPEAGDAPRRPPGMPTHAAIEIAWDADGDARREKFGPWLTGDDDTYSHVAASFAGGWCTAKGIDDATVTLFIGGEEIAEGATSPYPSA